MTFWGMDLEQVRGHADGLAAQAQRLETLIGQVDGAVDQAGWVWPGPDSDAFRDAWHSSYRTSLDTTARQLGDAVGVLYREIEEQAAASGESVPGRSGTISAGPSGPGDSDGTWIDPTNPSWGVSGSHALIHGQHGEYSPAPGSTEWWDSNSLTADGSLGLDASGLHGAAGIHGTIIGSGSDNHFPIGDSGAFGDLNYHGSLGADGSASGSLGPTGGSVEAQAMAGITAGVDGGVGNDDYHVSGGAGLIIGVGASGEAHANIHDGHISVGVHGGLAFIIGPQLHGEVDVDVSAPLHAVEQASHNVLGFFGLH